jgi:hydroxypyruvate isomerase
MRWPLAELTNAMRFDPNLSILFPDLPLLARPAAAAAAGFDAAELWWPYDGPEPTARDVDDLVEAFGRSGVRLVLLNLWLGDSSRGQHGLLSVADQEAAFRANVDAAAALVQRLGGSVVNAHYGNVARPDRRAGLDDLVVARLAWAAPRVADAGAALVLEALNPLDFPRYGIHHVREAVALVRRAREQTPAPIGILFDIYHVVRAGDDPLAELAAAGREVGHVQVADVPGRGRPGSGAIPFDAFLAALDRSGYPGYVGLEYVPSADPVDTFAWLPLTARRTGRIVP